MKLIHFGTTKLTTINSTGQLPDPTMKPKGLWVSDETKGAHGWKQWCKDEDFASDRFVYATTVTLTPDANILYIHTATELDTFTTEYRADTYMNSERTVLFGTRPHTYQMTYDIDWQRVAEQYDGIVITPYIWERRLTEYTTWYYSWDCASGCIWNGKAIANITSKKLRTSKKEPA